jgi:hypothetical protein
VIQVAQPVLPDATSAPATTPENVVANAFFHVDLIPAGDKRDLKIRRIGVAPALNSSNVRRPSGAPVKVTTDPPGAELTIEGDAEQHCQSPCVLSLPAARQMIHIKMDGFRTEDRALEVKPAGSELSIALEPEFGVVEFKGSQGETPIFYDGRKVGSQVPASVRLPVGKYEIRTSQDGKILNREEVEVTSAGTNVVTVKKP